MVRVSVRLINEGTGNNAEVVVLINGGTESEVPIIVVTLGVARYLELNLNDMDEVDVELASVTTCNYIPRSSAMLDDEGGVWSKARVHIAVDEGLNESLMMDTAIDELDI